VGGGKSNEINCILTPLIGRNSPADMRLFLIDMKRVELSFYKDIPHLGGDMPFVRKISIDEETGKEKISKNLRIVEPDYQVKPGYKKFDPLGQKIITRPQDIVPLLDYLLAEIERRTQILERAEIKKISTWNNRHAHDKLSYWILVIDELGDIMLRSEYKKKVEERLVRIFQLGRALGIHCVVATQTPKSSIITGLITNNITNWIVFRCSTGVSSGLVLDGRYDAARLPAVKGRCIFREGGQMIEMQTPYISDSAIKSAVDAAKKGDVMDVMDARLTVEADKIFKYALTELDGYCPQRQLYRQFRKDVSLHDIENILCQFEVKGTPPGLEPEITIDEIEFYLSPPLTGIRKPRQLIEAKKFIDEFDNKWRDVLIPHSSSLTKNCNEPGDTNPNPDEVTEDLESIFA
jgi:DNA segregation ATPase FtsK/SpoIIIE-like protein